MSKQKQKVPLSGLISISEAATLVPYSAEYLSLLARTGKLNAVKIARNWLTTREAVFLYLQKQKEKHVSQMKYLTKAEQLFAAFHET